MNPNWLTPNWAAPANIRAVCTTGHGGVSAPPFASLNLGDHVGDDPYAVARNRMIVGDVLQLPTEPLWLQPVSYTHLDVYKRQATLISMNNSKSGVTTR